MWATDGFFMADAFDWVRYKADDVSESDHPDPFGFVLVPDEQFVDVFGHHDVDGSEKGDWLVDGAHGWVDRHAVVDAVGEQNFGDEGFEGALGCDMRTTLLTELLLSR